MKHLRYLLSFATVFGLFFCQVSYAAEDSTRFDDELNERDFDALRDFLKSRKAIDVEEKSSDLIFSGDIRTEWRHMNESCKGKELRGGDSTNLRGLPISVNDFDVEFNLTCNYVFNACTWAVAHVRYDNSAGVDDNDHPCYFKNTDGPGCCKKQSAQCLGDPEGYHGSGKSGDLHLKKAYMGYNIYNDGVTKFDVELGRRGNLYNVFDSSIQFLSRFDGLLLKYDTTIENYFDCYLHAAGFVVDERVNHFAWVAELGLMDIYDSNVDFKYSFIDWEKHGKNRCFARNPRGFQFLNSQFYLGYHLDPELIGKSVKFYGAFLVNHAAKKIQAGEHKKAKNLGWYVGVIIGKVRKEGDWAIEIEYQLVQAQAMPDDDCGGICRGNVLDESFTTCSRRGNTNFKGWQLEGLYAFTDNITIATIIEWSKAEDPSIGGRHTYSKLEVEAIYAF